MYGYRDGGPIADPVLPYTATDTAIPHPWIDPQPSPDIR